MLRDTRPLLQSSEDCFFHPLPLLFSPSFFLEVTLIYVHLLKPRLNLPVARVIKHTSEIVLSRRRDSPYEAKAQSSSRDKRLRSLPDRVKPKMSRTKLSMLESLTVMLKKIEAINMKLDNLLVRGDYKLDDMKKEARNTNQRRAGLQHQAQQPRLAMKEDVLRDKKTRESTEDFAQDGRLGDISSDRVHDPMR